MKVGSNRGQSSVEALVVALGLVAACSALLGTLYFSFVHSGLSYLLHEHLVCEQSQGSVGCRDIFDKRARPFLIFARVLKFECTHSRQRVRNLLIVQMPLGKQLRFANELEIYR